MQRLIEISGEMAGVVEKTAPAVVRVEAGRRMPGSGTVWAGEGVIVTADHVLEREEGIQIGLSDGRTVGATPAGRDPSTDVAVLRVEASGLPVPAWIDADRVRVGELVLALGRPGRTVRARLGLISALGEAWRAPAGGEIDRYLEADVAVTAGFSGGPLVDTAGAVLGMNTSGLLRGAALSVPTQTLRRVVGALLAHGRIRRGYLGIGAHPVRLPARLAREFGQESGLIVVSVEPGSPAERGGLLIGDVIVSIDSAAVRRHGDVQAHLPAESIGRQVTVRLIRGGTARELSITVGERP